MIHLKHNPILQTLIYLPCSLILLAIISYILRNGTQEWLWIALIFLVILFLFLLWKVPEWQIASLRKSTEPEKIIALKNELRKTLAQIMGGLLILVSLFGTWKTIEISKETADDNLRVSHENLRVSQEGQITERFTRAVEHLGNAKLEIRLGGIYALERISKDSPKDYWQVMEILTAYVRENSPSDLKQNPTNKLGGACKDEPNKSPPSTEAEKLSTDIQAILSVIGRRILDCKKVEEQPLDLGKTNLCVAKLEGARLEGANLGGANLTGANMRDAHLQRANLEGANLEGANLTGANLTGAFMEKANLERTELVVADLTGARLKGANLFEAYLREANLTGAILDRAFMERVELNQANLEGAFLTGANLRGANLSEARLDGANLNGAKLDGANLWGASLLNADLAGGSLVDVNLEKAFLVGINMERSHLEGVDLKGQSLYRANLRGAFLQGTNVEGVDFCMADLRDTHDLTIEQLSKVKILYGAKLDQGFIEQIKNKYPHLLESPKEWVIPKPFIDRVKITDKR